VAQFQLAEGAPLHPSSPGLAAAMNWARSTPWEEGELVAAYRFLDLIYQYEHSRIARAQIFLAWAHATGDRSFLPETLAYLERQSQVAERSGLLWFQIKLSLLQALAHHALGNVPQSHLALEQALRRAAPEGYIRIFLDEGEPMRLLLLAFRGWVAQQPPDEQQHRLLSYIDRLVQALGPTPTVHNDPASQAHPSFQTPNSKRQPLVEPLSERELEILRLVNEGLSNSEIADQLIITVGTVKKHLNNIFGKLSVSRRTQAIVAARTLNLL
jgi:LuxR family maltose regulon positive regulatory protein